jgi:hypothetical protein
MNEGQGFVGAAYMNWCDIAWLKDGRQDMY